MAHTYLSMLSVFVLLAAGKAANSSPSVSLSVVCKGDNSAKRRGLPQYICSKPSSDYEQDGWTARSTLRDDNGNRTGWGELYVQTPEGGDDTFLQAYAAGYIEGWISARPINLFWQSNIFKPQDKVVDFVNENNEWMKEQVLKLSDGDHYWQQVHVLLQQLQGITDGYNDAMGNAGPQSPSYLSYNQLQYLQLQVELGDIEKAVDESKRYNFSSMNLRDMQLYELKELHCSAIFKVTPSLDEIYASHVTWSHYNDMLRFVKTYDMPLLADSDSTKASKIKFSGYPGTLPGIDDFYITNQDMVIIETTNGFYNNSLYDYITPENTVPYWIRVMVASRMSSSAPGWHEIFYKYNSGTYSNQWMTLDYKLFKPGHPLLDNTFVVSEQLPGHYHVQDQTMTLQRGYWPSYNRIYYEDLYEIAGYPAVVKEKGVSQSYQLAPRAKLFRRDAGKIASMEDLEHFMRSNFYSKTNPDPLAETPLDAISARGDLMSPPIYGGAIDGKIASFELVKNFSIRAVSGPTHDTQPIFSWANVSMESCPHIAQPPKFPYEWDNY